METTDAELLSRCRDGDHTAWETVVRRHHKRIYNFAYRFGGRFDEAEDLTQETFTAVVVGVMAGRREALTMPWVMGIARHKLIDHYRRAARNEQHLALVGAESPEPVELDLLDSTDPTRVLVRHIPNPSSGGQTTDTGVTDFLSTNGTGPEYAAVRQQLELSADEPR